MQLVTRWRRRTCLRLACCHTRPIRWRATPCSSADLETSLLRVGKTQWIKRCIIYKGISLHGWTCYPVVCYQQWWQSVSQQIEKVVALHWWHSFPVLIRLKSRFFFLLLIPQFSHVTRHIQTSAFLSLDSPTCHQACTLQPQMADGYSVWGWTWTVSLVHSDVFSNVIVRYDETIGRISWILEAHQ